MILSDSVQALTGRSVIPTCLHDAWRSHREDRSVCSVAQWEETVFIKLDLWIRADEWGDALALTIWEVFFGEFLCWKTLVGTVGLQGIRCKNAPFPGIWSDELVEREVHTIKCAGFGHLKKYFHSSVAVWFGYGDKTTGSRFGFKWVSQEQRWSPKKIIQKPRLLDVTSDKTANVRWWTATIFLPQDVRRTTLSKNKKKKRKKCSWKGL